VERVTFHHPENGFCVPRVRARGQRDLITVIGHAAMITAGELMQLTDTWINDRTHGLQFRAAFPRQACHHAGGDRTLSRLRDDPGHRRGLRHAGPQPALHRRDHGKHLVGQRQAFAIAVRNQSARHRWPKLRECSRSARPPSGQQVASGLLSTAEVSLSAYLSRAALRLREAAFATGAFGLRPRPICFASDERRLAYSGATIG
jgi:hypothetical protein